MSYEANILRRAKARISDPKNWCKGELARDGYGCKACFDSPNATSWCASGAILAEVGFTAEPSAGHFLAKAAGCDSIPYINDNGTHEDVMALYNRAIELAEEAEEKRWSP